MDVDVTAIPLREAGMAPFEIMTSESQERMLAIITPEHLGRGRGALCEVGGARDGRRSRRRADGRTRRRRAVAMLRVRDGFDGEVLAEVPASSLADEAPLYDRPMSAPRGPRRDQRR